MKSEEIAALDAAKALKYRAALSGNFFHEALELFGEDISLEEVAKFLDLPPTVFKYCLKMRKTFYCNK